MKNRRDDYFSTHHPIVNFIYFVVVIGASMFLMHPVFLTISLVSALSYNVLLCGWRKTICECVIFILPIMIIVSVINALFNHYGMTILFYLYNGNPITLESIVYGIAMAVMLFEVIAWFRCYNAIMTSDKFIYLFGKVIPSLSLIISMCMRFVPRFKNRMQIVRNGQKCIGRDVSNGNILNKIKNGIRSLSILITWSLENAIDTADSMKARGYGLRGRTAFSIYRFDRRDKGVLCVMASLALIFIVGCARGFTYVQYNPWIEVKGIPPTAVSIIIYAAYAIFCMLPIIMDLADGIRWKKYRKKIEPGKQKGYRLWT